jgi:hypothetical protein
VARPARKGSYKPQASSGKLKLSAYCFDLPLEACSLQLLQ